MILRLAIGDSSLSQIVRGQLDRNAVTRYDADKMFPHLASNMSYNLMAILEFYTELGTRQGLNYRAAELDYFFISSHTYN